MAMAMVAVVTLAACGSVSPSAKTVPSRPVSTFVPVLLTQSADRSTVFVLGSDYCATGFCLDLRRTAAGATARSGRFTRLVAPPSAAPNIPELTGSIQKLVFANRTDGYAIEDDTGASTPWAGPLYVTGNGGKSWRAVNIGDHIQVMAMVASSSEFYAVFVHCLGPPDDLQCDDFQLAKSAIGTTTWSSVPIPDTTGVDFIDISVEDGMVWLMDQIPMTFTTRLIESIGGVAPFVATAEPALRAVTACSPTAMAGGAIWASCPTGETETYLRQARPGLGFKRVLVSETVVPFAPVTGAIAYVYSGEEPNSSGQRAHKMERTVDGGKTFRSLARLAFGGAIAPQLVFANVHDGMALGEVRGKDGSFVPESLFRTRNGGTFWTKIVF
jgi:hypothetical protein